MKTTGTSLVSGVVLCWVASVVLAAPSFTLIGRPSNPPAESHARCISADGSVVAGYNQTTDYRGFLWRNAVRSDETAISIIAGMSSDGTYVTGTTALSSNIPPTNVWRYSQTGGFEDLGAIPNRRLACSGIAMNADGNTIVGYATGSQSGLRIPYRWRSGVGVTELPDINGGNSGFSYANGVSDDGDIVVGSSTSVFGIIDDRPLYWDAAGSPHRLFPPAGTPTATGGSALAVSGNGRVIVGGFGGSIGAAVWIDGVANWLVTNDGRRAGSANGVNYDGSVIIGGIVPLPTDRSSNFIYTTQTGIVEATRFLLNNGVPISPTGTIEQLTCVSRDGLSFAGTYIDLANGIERQAFVATIPSPGVTIIIGVAAVAVTRRRLRKYPAHS